MSDTSQNLSKEEWSQCMAKVQARDKESYAVIFRHFAPKLKLFAYKQLGNEQIAMEMVHETLAVVWQKSELFDPSKSALSTWIYTIIRNKCFDFLRKQKGKELSIHSEDIWPSESYPPDLVEHYSPEQDRFKQQVLKHIHQLPKKQREVVQAVYLQDLPQQQVAEQFNIPLGTVKSRLRTAIEQLRNSIQTEGLR
ncbi:sigma-70 family RNA polymerase sigma factor [Vibrio sp. SCSIO 43136]|uniref:sigma-70 family RNA polymerase sigma factor n=1 Tax=Vibrio sp. SCSIO 43136 TaxID=2819101 RepID=UPI002074EC1D|nr:sigma-70 family RNA polymerase sigma factor [Vibrio sp. SCSIO 43136]USD65357.1 sigma-70 family RNA polymerase sigma factor [Vibrio sp. SCSIO 43136]